MGFWPIGEHVPALRTTKCRKAGTLVWRNESVTKEVYRKLLLEKIVPEIQEKWPRGKLANPARVIRIQQDGPNSHILPTDAEWNQGLREQGLHNKIILYTQPANSPDLNINDLGLLRALDASYKRNVPKSYDDIIKMVRQVYEDYPMKKINYIYLTLMSCLNEIIECGGDNDYSIPHLGKDKLEREGNLPETLEVSEDYKSYLDT